jgi:peptidoglycan/LPS O-acetylase OafA/YrhL
LERLGQAPQVILIFTSDNHPLEQGPNGYLLLIISASSLTIGCIMQLEQFHLKYTPALDGLRATAILLVMAFHARAPFFKGGFIGVDVFFVLSGFLITSLLIFEYDRFGSVSLKHFYMRRFLRLAPALILLLVIFCIGSFLFLGAEKAKSNYIDSVISLFYLSNWARAFSTHAPDYLGHTWSLSIEEQFYIVWPMVLLTMLRSIKSRKWIVFLTLSIALLAWGLRAYMHAKGASPERLYNGLDTRADALMVGCSLGVVYASGFFNVKNNTEILSRIFSCITPLSLFTLLLFSFSVSWRAPYMYQFLFFVINILTITIVINLIFNEKNIVSRLLSTRPMVWTGSISYGLYLWHYPIYRTLFSLKFDWLVVITAGSLITFILAALSFYLLEKPILVIKQHYTHPSIKT